MTYQIREIQKPDDPIVEAIIRACLVEFGGNHAGTAWADPDLCRFSEIYRGGGARYWVAADAAGQIVGGAGVGPLAGRAGGCGGYHPVAVCGGDWDSVVYNNTISAVPFQA